MKNLLNNLCDHLSINKAKDSVLLKKNNCT